MSRYFILYKPFDVLSTFTDEEGRTTLKNFFTVPGVYAAGRLDHDSEGLLLLTDDGELIYKLTAPRHAHGKRYLVQVEGVITPEAVAQLRQGVAYGDTHSLPAQVEIVPEPNLPPRGKPVRDYHPTSWIEVVLREGKKRQIRHITAAVGFPTLRLVRVAIGPLTLGDLKPGEWRELRPGEVKQLRDFVGGGEPARPTPHTVSPARREPAQARPPRRDECPAAGPRPYQPRGARRDDRPVPGSRPYQGRGPRRDDRPAAGPRPHRPGGSETAPRTGTGPARGPRRDDRPAAGPRPYQPRGARRDDRPAAGPRPTRYGGPRPSQARDANTARPTRGPRRDERPAAAPGPNAGDAAQRWDKRNRSTSRTIDKPGARPPRRTPPTTPPAEPPRTEPTRPPRKPRRE